MLAQITPTGFLTIRVLRLGHIVKALVIFVLVDFALAIINFDQVRSFVKRRKTMSLKMDSSLAGGYIDDCVYAVERATRWYYRSRLDCLPKSVTLFLMLKTKVPVDLCIGVKKFPFSGHAWVEHNGKVIGDNPRRVQAYTVLSRV
jgi:Transglutaminase-like superfamily